MHLIAQRPAMESNSVNTWQLTRDSRFCLPLLPFADLGSCESRNAKRLLTIYPALKTGLPYFPSHRRAGLAGSVVSCPSAPPTAANAVIVRKPGLSSISPILDWIIHRHEAPQNHMIVLCAPA